MISFIKGNVEVIGKDYIVIENNGIGFLIKATLGTISKATKGAELKIFTHMQVREDDISLYGFLYQDELNMFTMLTSVSGIGPKGALAILDLLSPSDIMLYIVSEDSKALSKAKGVGLKTAQRIILELKDKMKANSIVNSDMDLTTYVAPRSNSSLEVIDAIDALIALGYEKSDAVKSVNIVYTENMSVQDTIKKALKNLSS
ncbi:MAG: Holliday junction branch migration protein RuvA [Lachnospirales bacterium]